MSTEGESDEVTHAAKQFFKQCVTQSKQMWPLLEPTTRNTHVSRHNLGLGHLLSCHCTVLQSTERQQTKISNQQKAKFWHRGHSGTGH